MCQKSRQTWVSGHWKNDTFERPEKNNQTTKQPRNKTILPKTCFLMLQYHSSPTKVGSTESIDYDAEGDIHSRKSLPRGTHKWNNNATLEKFVNTMYHHILSQLQEAVHQSFYLNYTSLNQRGLSIINYTRLSIWNYISLST